MLLVKWYYINVSSNSRINYMETIMIIAVFMWSAFCCLAGFLFGAAKTESGRLDLQLEYEGIISDYDKLVEKHVDEKRRTLGINIDDCTSI